MSKKDYPFDGPIVGSYESNALRLLLRLAEARNALRNAAGKPAYLQAVTDEWVVLQEIDRFTHYVQQREG